MLGILWDRSQSFGESLSRHWSRHMLFCWYHDILILHCHKPRKCCRERNQEASSKLVLWFSFVFRLLEVADIELCLVGWSSGGYYGNTHIQAPIHTHTHTHTHARSEGLSGYLFLNPNYHFQLRRFDTQAIFRLRGSRFVKQKENCGDWVPPVKPEEAIKLSSFFFIVLDVRQWSQNPTHVYLFSRFLKGTSQNCFRNP